MIEVRLKGGHDNPGVAKAANKATKPSSRGASDCTFAELVQAFPHPCRNTTSAAEGVTWWSRHRRTGQSEDQHQKSDELSGRAHQSVEHEGENDPRDKSDRHCCKGQEEQGVARGQAPHARL